MDNTKTMETIATVVAAIVGITQIFGFFTENQSTLKILIVFLCVINLFFVFMIIKTKKDTQAKTREYKKNLSELEYNFYKDECVFINGINNFSEDRIEDAQTYFRDRMVKYVTGISEIMSLHAEKDPKNGGIEVSLRCFEEDNIKEIKTAVVVPLAVSDTCNSVRKEAFSARQNAIGRSIGKNTDFKFICDTSSTYFYSQDLTKLSDYENENLQYAKYYRGKIVYPVKVDNHHELGYEGILGFLIADTSDDKLFTKENEDYYINLIKLYAQKTAELLYKYKVFLNRAENKEDNKIEG